MDIGYLWNELLVAPLAQALMFLALLTGSGGWAIILFTIGIKIVLLPLTWQQIRSQKAMAVLQPQLKAAQKKYGKDRQRLSEETMRIYRENNVNPAAGCLPLVIQMPIWFALYQALVTLGHPDQTLVAIDPDLNPFRTGFLWLENLGQPDYLPFLIGGHEVPNPILPLLTAITQFGIQRMMTPPTVDPQQQQMNRAMQLMPLMFFFFSLNFASGLVLYWVTSNVVSFVQQYFLTGWGGLFPGGYRPNTPFAGSWGPGDLPDPPSDGGGSGPAGGDQSGASAGPSSRRREQKPRAGGPNDGRAPPRASKERRRSAKR